MSAQFFRVSATRLRMLLQVFHVRPTVQHHSTEDLPSTLRHKILGPATALQAAIVRQADVPYAAHVSSRSGYFRRRRVRLMRFAFAATRRRYRRTISSPDAPASKRVPASKAASSFSETFSSASRRACLPPRISFSFEEFRASVNRNKSA